MAGNWGVCETLLRDGAAGLGLRLSDAQRAQLIRYLQELARWNRTYSLTAVRDPEDMVTRHLLDSLAVLPHLAGRRVIDVGSGPGLPGIPLALADPAREFLLLDSNGKKVTFMRHALRELQLANAGVRQDRVEQYAAGEGRARFDCVISRAFASLADMLTQAGPLCAPGGRILAMKGRLPDDEIRALDAAGLPYRLERSLPLQVPGLAAERHLVIFSPAA